MTLKNIIQERWQLPPAEHIHQIAADYGVTAEVMEQVARFAAWDALQAAYEAELGESPWQTRELVGV
jgi:hypothetical protein